MLTELKIGKLQSNSDYAAMFRVLSHLFQCLLKRSSHGFEKQTLRKPEPQDRLPFLQHEHDILRTGVDLDRLIHTEIEGFQNIEQGNAGQ